MMVLQANQITKEYQGMPVLTGVTFHLAGGERVGLVGANGCGKSTLMKILAGEMAADGGSVSWVTDGLSRAYLSQDGAWDPDGPIGEQMGPVPDDLLAKCGLTRAMLARVPGRLSGGQKTRAALARALANREGVPPPHEPPHPPGTARPGAPENPPGGGGGGGGAWGVAARGSGALRRWPEDPGRPGPGAGEPGGRAAAR